MGKMKEHLLRLHHDERGAMSTEMILIIALIGVPLVLFLAAFRDKILGYFSGQQSKLADPPSP